MLIKSIIKSTNKNIQKNKLRSLLTSLGIIIGVSSVIVMSAIGAGTQALIEQEISSLGTNVIIVFPGASKSGGINKGAGSLNRFTLDDVEKIKKNAKLINAISPIVVSGGQIVGGGRNWASLISGVTTDYFQIKNRQLENGYYFTKEDISTSRKVALIGKTVADELFPNEDPTGQKIRIRNIPFTILGILKEKGQSGMGQDQDDIVLAPATTVLYRLKGGRYIDLIMIGAVSVDNVENAEEEIRDILRESHGLQNNDEDDFMIQTQTEITETVTRTSKLLTVFLGAIASISLIVGGIGIMNIMLVSVTERTREIGIRMSVGARRSDIMVQFLAEAVTLSIMGGFLGILFSFFIVFSVNEFTDYNALIKAQILFISVVFSGAVGILFGYFPAQKAAALNPIDALRYE
jgi:putative ABC transport system permease protein